MNGDISPETNSQPSQLDKSESESANNGHQTLSCYTKLKKIATHLANICSVTIKQQDARIFSEEDSDFANLVSNCGNKLTGLGEYLLDLANRIQENQ